MLSDVFAWIGNKIYAIHSVGNNYAHLDILKCNIDEKYILRAEGYVVLIEQAHLNDVNNILKTYGYTI